MKKHFMVILLYGTCFVLSLIAMQHGNLERFMERFQTSLSVSVSHLTRDSISTRRGHRLPAVEEDTLCRVLNASLRHRFMLDNDRGEALKEVIHDNRTAEPVLPWQRFLNGIRRHLFYSEDDSILDEVLQKMKKLNIVEIREDEKSGTEFKFFIKLSDGTPVIGKPLRLPVDKEPPPDMSKNDFYERFQSEIAAFHLSRVLKLHLVPPVVSRYVNLKSEIYEMAPEGLKETFFERQDGATCLTGHCRKKCNERHAICGQPDVIPVSFAFLLPKTVINGWVANPVHAMSLGRSGNRHYCEKVTARTAQISKAARTHMDVVDISVFDFILGNLDRHHFGRIVLFGDDSQLVLFDNGRGFARSYQDEFDLLYPLYKCCRIRLSTFEKLIGVYKSAVRLSGAMKKSLAGETVQPLLTERHLMALDRRLVKVLEIIYGCVGMNGQNGESTLINDGY